MSTDNDFVVSICMITFNHGRYIKKAIEGVMLQKCSFAIELIIGDDCSTDETRSICCEFKNMFPTSINLLFQDKNLGMIPNFLNTLQGCKGKYIALCEGDDFWTSPYKLQKQVDFLENHKEYGLIHSDCDFYFQTKNKLIKNWDRKSSVVIPDGHVFLDLLVNNFVKTLTVCFRKDLMQDFEYQELFQNQNWLQGDYPIWLSLSQKTKFSYIPESLATRRILDESASNFKQRINKTEFILSAYKINSYFIEKYGCPKRIKDEININKNKVMMRYAFYLNDKVLAQKVFTELIGLAGYRRLGLKLYLFYVVLHIQLLNKILRILLK
jgi:glycosyltransferase involved in cell wall biosynthesis